jgi:hypothetical protein
MGRKKLILEKCEIDNCNETKCLEIHHIIPRSDLNTTNHDMNLCILCSLHHSYLHAGLLKIIGIYPSTRPPNGRTVVYELNGKRNIDIDKPFIEFKPKSFKIFNGEDK